MNEFMQVCTNFCKLGKFKGSMNVLQIEGWNSTIGLSIKWTYGHTVEVALF